MKILLTGGAGFIGSSVIRQALSEKDIEIVNVDILTYAGNLDSLASIDANPNYAFEQVNICDATAIAQVFARHQPTVVMHLAAESHVDRSIDNPSDFIQTNIVGTYTLLEQSRIYWQSLGEQEKGAFRFHHISTDEVYGDLEHPDDFFTETTAYAPSSPCWPFPSRSPCGTPAATRRETTGRRRRHRLTRRRTSHHPHRRRRRYRIRRLARRPRRPRRHRPARLARCGEF